MILAEKMYFIFKNPDAKNVGNPFVMKSRNIVWIARNVHSAMYKAEAYGFTKVLSLGLSISLNIIIEERSDYFMQRNFIEYMGKRFRSGE